MESWESRASLRLSVGLLALVAPAWVLAATLATPAARSAPEWMAEAYRRKATRDLAGAAAAFEAARATGADAQRVDLELAYVALERGDPAAARRRLEAAAGGPDAALGDRARAQLAFVPGHLRGDLYWDAYGWRGVAGDAHVANEVPTLRLRAHYRPWLDRDLSLYAYAQATRDRASSGGALPRIYADDALVVGPGALLALWGRRAGLFLQAGWAWALVDDGRARARLDARGGAFLSVESAGCAPPPAEGARLAAVPCADGYGEAVWLGRFDDELVAFARGRAGAGWLVTGPVAWQLLVEARGAANRRRAAGDPFAEAGLWHRWRLLRPARVDALVGVQEGRAFSLGATPPARRRAYAELRFQLTTSLEF